jgi:hypothetical protein
MNATTSPVQNTPITSQRDIARIAAAILFSVAASVWLINEGDVRVAVLRWLLIVLTIGLIVNSQAGLSTRAFGLAGTICSLALIAGASFQSYIICRQTRVLSPPLLTGINMCEENVYFLAVFLLLVFVLTAIAVCLAGLCRPLTVDTLKLLPKCAANAKKIERSLRALAISVAAIFVALKILAKI